MLYDMGMVRLYTEEVGVIRAPRPWVGPRGTDEWMALNGELGMEQVAATREAPHALRTGTCGRSVGLVLHDGRVGELPLAATAPVGRL